MFLHFHAHGNMLRRVLILWRITLYASEVRWNVAVKRALMTSATLVMRYWKIGPDDFYWLNRKQRNKDFSRQNSFTAGPLTGLVRTVQGDYKRKKHLCGTINFLSHCLMLSKRKLVIFLIFNEANLVIWVICMNTYLYQFGKSNRTYDLLNQHFVCMRIS